jgi:DNA-binding NarL/FixJ family response regulator
VTLAQGEAVAAAAVVRLAIERWTDLSAPYEVARSRVLLSRALRLEGDEPSAMFELTLARETFAALGAKPAEQEVTQLLGTSKVPGGLSQREVEVLRMVAAGKTNSEIAAELFVAEKTVARHLSNIFTKLDVRSRTAAAAFAYEHRLL